MDRETLAREMARQRIHEYDFSTGPTAVIIQRPPRRPLCIVVRGDGDGVAAEVPGFFLRERLRFTCEELRELAAREE